MVIATASEVRNNFKSYLDRVNEDFEEVHIVRERGCNAVLISETEWDSIQETLLVYQNAEVMSSLQKSLRQLDEGAVVEFESIAEVFEDLES
jgi:antitoxin YefM